MEHLEVVILNCTESSQVGIPIPQAIARNQKGFSMTNPNIAGPTRHSERMETTKAIDSKPEALEALASNNAQTLHVCQYAYIGVV